MTYRLLTGNAVIVFTCAVLRANHNQKTGCVHAASPHWYGTKDRRYQRYSAQLS